MATEPGPSILQDPSDCRIFTAAAVPTNPVEGLKETFSWYVTEDRRRPPKFSFYRKVLGQ
ncbi:MAG: hypothetical protein AABX97_09575 [Candidatus Thermoplasmatota archaeon]